jgi:hypothetical protein
MDLGTLLMVGMAGAVLVIGAFFGLIFLALLTYVVKNLWPPGRRVSLWAAKLDNFIPLLLLDVVLVFLIILIAIVAVRLPTIAALLLILVLFLLVIILMIVGFLVLMALINYIVRLASWFYRRWKGLLGGFIPQVMKLKIKHDMGKDKDWTTHFTELRQRLSEEAEQARRKITGGGKT